MAIKIHYMHSESLVANIASWQIKVLAVLEYQ